jgi:hypothetical protein
MNTRGAQEAHMRENKIVNTYRRLGGALIEGHGALVNMNSVPLKDVPPDTVIIFLAKFGQCMYIEAGRLVANRYFKNNSGLERFFRGAGAEEGLHHANILNRTRFEGQKYPDIEVSLRDKSYKSFGYIWKLPLGRTRAMTGEDLLAENRPRVGEVREPFNRRTYKLSTLLDRLGPGVYIVNTCLVIPNYNPKRLPSNAPVVSWGGTRTVLPPGGSRIMRRIRPHIAATSFARPGVRRRTWLPEASRRRPQPAAALNLENALEKISTNPRVNFENLTENLRANLRIQKLRRVYDLLHDRTRLERFAARLNSRTRTTFREQPALRGSIIYKRIR